VGQPGHPVLNRLGISNFWNYNTVGKWEDKRNFINSLTIKRLMIYYIKLNNYFIHEYYANNKWFNVNTKDYRGFRNLYWRVKTSIIPYYSMNKPFVRYEWRARMLSFYTSRLQIYRYEGWLIIGWFVFNSSGKYTELNKDTEEVEDLDVWSMDCMFFSKFLIMLKLKKTTKDSKDLGINVF